MRGSQQQLVALYLLVICYYCLWVCAVKFNSTDHDITAEWRYDASSEQVSSGRHWRFVDDSLLSVPWLCSNHWGYGSGIMWLCARITLGIIGDLAHSWTKCTQSSNLRMIHLSRIRILLYNIVNHNQSQPMLMWNASFLSTTSYWHHSLPLWLQKCCTCLSFCTGTWMIKFVNRNVVIILQSWFMWLCW